MDTDATHLWIIDGDVEVPDHALCSLLQLKADIASGVYTFHNHIDVAMFGRMKDEAKYQFIPRSLDVFKEQILGEDFYVGGGNGCMLITRRVFQKHHPNIKPLRFRSPAGRGSDVYFWYEAQRAGFKCRIHGGVICGHLPEWPLKKMQEEFQSETSL
jgi:hypothetical protein